MSNSPRYVGYLDPPYKITLTDDSGAAVPLTGTSGSSFTITFASSTATKNGTGFWTITDLTGGKASYQYGETDLNTPGVWQIYVTVQLPGEATPREFDPDTMIVYSVPIGVTPSPIPTPPVQIINPNVFNVKDYGAKGDGSADDTTAITGAISAANTAGGGMVYFPAGTYISGNQTISAHVFFRGVGKTATTIKLKNNTNTDLFSAQTGLINLSAGGGSSAQGTLYDFGFADLTLDGNKANQSSGPSYCLRFYGYSYIMQNLEIKNGYSGNVLSDWNGGNSFPPADSMMALWSGVKSHDSAAIGVEIGGPHDSLFVNCEFFQDLSHNLHLAPNANGCCLSNIHAWGPGVNTPNTASFLQTVYGTDTFHRANQSGLGTASDGLVWNQSPSSGTVTAAISSNTATFAGNGSEADGIFTHGSSSVSGGIDTRMDLNQNGDSSSDLGLYWYGDGTSNNGYRCVFDHGNLVVQKYVSGVRSTLSIVASGIGNPQSTICTIRVQQSGTTIRAKVWPAGTFEPTTWLISTTDSSFSSGKFGMWIWINSGSGTVYSYAAGNLRTQSGKVAMLIEATGVNCANCIAESSDTVQVVALGPNMTWTGGNVYDVLQGYGFSSVSSGFQIGQQGGDTAYSGQITTPGNQTVFYCRVADVLIVDCQGANGAIWLDNDQGYNIFDFTINQDLVGTDSTGTLHVHSVFRRSGLTSANTSVEILDSGVQLNKASTLYSGSGTPSSSLGGNGDYYFRTDTPGTANQRLYVKSSGSWAGIV